MSSLGNTIPFQKQEEIFDCLLARPENKICADCSAKGPRWVSLDFGIFICMNCAGHHRNLGPSITRVRSVKLDSWKQEWVDIMENVGNEKANDFYEFGLPPGKKADSSWQTNDIRKFIGDKFVKKIWAPQDAKDPVPLFLSGGGKSSPNIRPSPASPVKPIHQRQQSNPSTKNEPQRQPTPPQPQQQQKPKVSDSIWTSFDTAPVSQSKTNTQNAFQQQNQQAKPTPKPAAQINLLDMDFDFGTGANKSPSLFETNSSKNAIDAADAAFKQFHSVCGPTTQLKKEHSAPVNQLESKTSWPGVMPPAQQPPIHQIPNQFQQQPQPQQMNQQNQQQTQQKIPSFSLMDLYDQKPVNGNQQPQQQQFCPTPQSAPNYNMFNTAPVSQDMNSCKDMSRTIPKGNFAFMDQYGRNNNQMPMFQNQSSTSSGGMMGFGANQPVKAQHFATGFNFPQQQQMTPVQSNQQNSAGNMQMNNNSGFNNWQFPMA